MKVSNEGSWNVTVLMVGWDVHDGIVTSELCTQCSILSTSRVCCRIFRQIVFRAAIYNLCRYQQDYLLLGMLVDNYNLYCAGNDYRITITPVGSLLESTIRNCKGQGAVLLMLSVRNVTKILKQMFRICKEMIRCIFFFFQFFFKGGPMSENNVCVCVSTFYKMQV